MNYPALTESDLEMAVLDWFQKLGYQLLFGPEIALGEAGAEREGWGDVVLVDRLRQAIQRLNPKLPIEAREEAIRKVLLPESPSLIVNNRAFHRMLRDGVEVEYRRSDGTIAGERARLVADDPDDNDGWSSTSSRSLKASTIAGRT